MALCEGRLRAGLPQGLPRVLRSLQGMEVRHLWAGQGSICAHQIVAGARSLQDSWTGSERTRCQEGNNHHIQCHCRDVL